MTSKVKILPVVQDLIPGQEDPLEKEMVTCFSILAWRILWTEEPGRLVHGAAELDMTERLTHKHFYTPRWQTLLFPLA